MSDQETLIKNLIQSWPTRPLSNELDVYFQDVICQKNSKTQEQIYNSLIINPNNDIQHSTSEKQIGTSAIKFNGTKAYVS